MSRKAHQGHSSRTRNGWRNALSLGGLAFVVSLFFSGPAQQTLQSVHTIFALVILLVILIIAIIADVLAVAATVAEEPPFHAMASRRVPGAREAVIIVRHGERVNSLCADVIGDICGTVSGAIAAPLIINFSTAVPTIPAVLWSMIVIGVIAALTVGGKAWTKGFALRNANAIVGTVGKGWYWIKRTRPRSRRL